MPEKIKILVVDDDRNICEIIKLYMQKECYEVKTEQDGKKVIELFKEFNPNIILLDIMLPNIDGYTLLKEIRKISDIPVIMITAKGETFDKISGLELGADDYVVKPFDSKELVARVKAVLRRYEKNEKPEDVISYPNLVINKSNYEVKILGEEVEFPPKELELLYFLASNPNKVFTRDQLLNQLWGYDFFGDDRTVDVHVKRIREKLELENQSWQLRTVWGVGYKFEVK